MRTVRFSPKARKSQIGSSSREKHKRRESLRPRRIWLGASPHPRPQGAAGGGRGQPSPRLTRWGAVGTPPGRGLQPSAEPRAETAARSWASLGRRTSCLGTAGGQDTAKSGAGAPRPESQDPSSASVRNAQICRHGRRGERVAPGATLGSWDGGGGHRSPTRGSHHPARARRRRPLPGEAALAAQPSLRT